MNGYRDHAGLCFILVVQQSEPRSVSKADKTGFALARSPWGGQLLSGAAEPLQALLVRDAFLLTSLAYGTGQQEVQFSA